jgi:5-methyltetrahydrofolate--homocysteine methyltransferase
MAARPEDDRTALLERLLSERILVLDGAMGTMVQTYRLDEAGFRGERFAAHPRDLKGNNDLLCITRPEIVEAIHRDYLLAGADIIETNTFNATSISLAEYGLGHLAHELNVAAARIARRAADAVTAGDPGRPRFVAGAIGPTNRMTSMSRDVGDPGARQTTFEDLRAAYYEQAKGLLEGGVDILLAETTFDVLNLKAALFAIEQLFDEGQRRVPVMASLTFVQEGSDRSLTGQNVEACWNSISHAPLLSVGINCAPGPKEMRPDPRKMHART